MSKLFRKRKTKKLRRSMRIIDSVTPGRRLKLLKLRKMISKGEYSTYRKLKEVFDEVIDDAKKENQDEE